MKNEIENILSIKVPEEYETYFNSNLSNLNKEDEIIIEIKHLSNDWKYTNYKFWLLKEINNEIENVYSKESTNKLSIIKTSQIIANEINQKVLCIAWSHNSVERDIGLFYIKDKIYGYSLNFSDNYQIDFLADSLEQLLNPNTRKVKHIEEIIQPKNWHLGDQECLTDGQEYTSILKEYFEQISNNKIRLSEVEVSKKEETISINLKINEESASLELDYHNGWIDDKIVVLMNKYLRRSNIEERFCILENPNWGQELGIAFCTKNEIKELESNQLIR